VTLLAVSAALLLAFLVVESRVEIGLLALPTLALLRGKGTAGVERAVQPKANAELSELTIKEVSR
jgi:hypothetical protein